MLINTLKWWAFSICYRILLPNDLRSTEVSISQIGFNNLMISMLLVYLVNQCVYLWLMISVLEASAVQQIVLVYDVHSRPGLSLKWQWLKTSVSNCLLIFSIWRPTSSQIWLDSSCFGLMMWLTKSSYNKNICSASILFRCACTVSIIFNTWFLCRNLFKPYGSFGS